MSHHDTVNVEGTYQAQTAKAVCLKIDDKEIWIPKSVIENLSDLDRYGRGDEVSLDIHEWFADKEGLG